MPHAVSYILISILLKIVPAQGLTAPEPPSFTEQPKPEIFFRVRENSGENERPFTLQCEASGQPPPEITWYKNGQYFRDDLYKRINRQPNRGTLVFSQPAESDEGLYQCRATNMHGIAMSNIAHVKKAALPPIITQGPERMKQVLAGSDVIIPCKAKGAPVPLITWTHDGKRPIGGRFEVLKEGLKIKGVQIVDAGTYRCHAANKLGRESAEGSLIVKGQTILTFVPFDLEVAAGNPATFRCSAKADDLPLAVIWLRNGEELDYDRAPRLTMTEDNSLRISKTVELDSGTYTCRAQTPLDFKEASATLTVQDVPDRPSMLGVDCHGLTAMVKWHPNGDDRASINNFVIEYNTSFTPDNWVVAFSTVPPTNSKFRVALSPYGDYTFRVIAQSKIGNSPPSEHSNRCSTPPDRPYKNPDNVEGYGTTSTNLVIKWTPMPLLEHNGPGFGYNIYWKRADVKEARFERRSVADWTESHITIPDQPTFKPYLIKVEAQNDRGQPYVTAPEITGYSGEGVPSAIPDLDAFPMGANTLHLRWIKPERPNGVLTGYRIEYQVVKGTALLQAKERPPITSPDETEAKLSGLEPDTTYRVTVRATTRQGPGDPFFIEVTTGSSVTGPPDAPDFKVTPLPGEDGKSVHRVEVEPAKSGNPGSSFKVEYRKIGQSQWSGVNLDPNQYWTLVRALEPSAQYELRVVAIEKTGSTPSGIKTLRVACSSSGHASSNSSEYLGAKKAKDDEPINIECEAKEDSEFVLQRLIGGVPIAKVECYPQKQLQQKMPTLKFQDKAVGTEVLQCNASNVNGYRTFYLKVKVN